MDRNFYRPLQMQYWNFPSACMPPSLMYHHLLSLVQHCLSPFQSLFTSCRYEWAYNCMGWHANMNYSQDPLSACACVPASVLERLHRCLCPKASSNLDVCQRYQQLRTSRKAHQTPTMPAMQLRRQVSDSVLHWHK